MSFKGAAVKEAEAGSPSHTVTVRIDQIKSLTLDQIRSVYSNGNSWLIFKRNELEACVEEHEVEHMADLMQQGKDCTVLKFHRSLGLRVRGSIQGGPGYSRSPSHRSASNHSHTPHSNASRTPNSTSNLSPRGQNDPSFLQEKAHASPEGAPGQAERRNSGWEKSITNVLSGFFSRRDSNTFTPTELLSDGKSRVRAEVAPAAEGGSGYSAAGVPATCSDSGAGTFGAQRDGVVNAPAAARPASDDALPACQVV